MLEKALRKRISSLETQLTDTLNFVSKLQPMMAKAVILTTLLERKGLITNGEIREEWDRLTKDQPNGDPGTDAGSGIQPECGQPDESSGSDEGAGVLRMPDDGADPEGEG